MTPPPLPPFTRESALQRGVAAEDAWNSRDFERVARAYTLACQPRNRDLLDIASKARQSTGLSRTQGAILPRVVRAATKDVVFQ
jgi:nuclear transport factor 2 (NTF2) superfamily protein